MGFGLSLAAGLLPVFGAGAVVGVGSSPAAAQTPADPGAVARTAGPAGQEPLEVWSAVSAGPLLAEFVRAGPDFAGPEVVIRSDATSRIVPQIASGAPADVVVTADRRWMREAVALGVARADEANLVAFNRLAFFERGPGTGAPDGPGAFRDRLESAPRDRPVLALAGPDVPLGRYARQALSALDLDAFAEGRIVDVGNARAVVNAVALGEVPLGIGYLTDVVRDPAVRVVGVVPTSAHDPAEVWAAPVLKSPRSESAEFVSVLASEGAADVIRAAGFLPPDAPATLAEIAPGGQPASGVALPPVGPVILRSVLVGLLAVLFATIPAVALGRWLARTRSPLRGPVGTLTLLPLVLPPVVTGFVLLALFGSSGVLGPLPEALGIRLSFSFWAAVMAAAVVGFPLYAVVVRNAFEAVDPHYEELAWTLGAPPRRTFWRVSLPLALPGVVAGAVLALARGLGEFGATIVVAGNIEGETQTLALAVYRLLESPEGRGRIWIFVTASVVIAALALAAWEWLTARQRARLLDRGGP